MFCDLLAGLKSPLPENIVVRCAIAYTARLSQIVLNQIRLGNRHIGIAGDDDFGLPDFSPAEEGGDVFGVDVDASVAHPVDTPFVKSMAVSGKKDAVVHVVDAGGIGVVFGHVVPFFLEDGVDTRRGREIVGSGGDGAGEPDISVPVDGIKTSITPPFAHGDYDEFFSPEIHAFSAAVFVDDFKNSFTFGYHFPVRVGHRFFGNK